MLYFPEVPEMFFEVKNFTPGFFIQIWGEDEDYIFFPLFWHFKHIDAKVIKMSTARQDTNKTIASHLLQLVSEKL